MLVEQIRNIVEDFIEEDLFLIDVILKGKKVGQKLLVLIDGDNGITIDRCAAISRHLSQVLDEKNLIEGKYQLEVSSPGLDHPVLSERQFRKNKGRMISVDTGNEKINGRLIDVTDNLILEVKEKKKTNVVEVPLSQIVKANVLVSFN